MRRSIHERITYASEAVSAGCGHEEMGRQGADFPSKGDLLQVTIGCPLAVIETNVRHTVGGLHCTLEATH